MRKYFLLLIIFVCIAYIGYSIKTIYKNKYNFFNSLLDFVIFLKNEIKNNKNSLLNIISNYQKSNSNILTSFLNKYIDVLNNKQYINIKNIIPKSIFLSNEEIVFIENLFNNIGKYDYDTELEYLSKTISNIEKYKEKAKEDLIKKGDLYFKLSIMLAISIVLIVV